MIPKTRALFEWVMVSLLLLYPTLCPGKLASIVVTKDNLISSVPQPSLPALPSSDPVEAQQLSRRVLLRTISQGPATNRRVALTFDDGPHPTITLKVLEELRARNVKATFFVLGERVKLYPTVLQQIYAEGHEIGNHTYTHHSLQQLSDRAAAAEVRGTQEIIKETIGIEPRLFRPPYGAMRAGSKSIIQEQNLRVVLWSVDPEDWKFRDERTIYNLVVHHVEGGSIILLHDIHPAIMQALPRILDELIAQGYEFTTVSELCGLPSVHPDVVQAPLNP